MTEPTIPVTNITPEKLSDEIDVILLVTTSDGSEGIPFVSAFTSAGHQDPELAARSALRTYDHQRFATLVRVRVPRALLRERWTEAKS
jgi:hypothetical protein